MNQCTKENTLPPSSSSEPAKRVENVSPSSSSPIGIVELHGSESKRSSSSSRFLLWLLLFFFFAAIEDDSPPPGDMLAVDLRSFDIEWRRLSLTER